MGPNPEQGKRFLDLLLRPEIRELLAASEVSQVPVQTGDTDGRRNSVALYIKPMQIDYGRLISQSKELSRGFLKDWVGRQK